VTAARTFATSHRVLDQLRHDPRTLGLMLVLPTALMTLVAWIAPPAGFQQFGPALLGIFPLFVMFLVTSVTTLRERTSGTLERLLSMPMAKSDFVFGYAVAFSLLAVAQSLVVAAVSFLLLGLEVAGSTWLVILVALVDALAGTALGLFVSAFARTEFQAIQFMPVVVIPQLLLCGLIVPTDQLPTLLERVSRLLPLTYGYHAMTLVVSSPAPGARFWLDVAVVAAMSVVLLLAGAATLRRRTP
jgi:ABC-2 type transport system permease protein